MLIRHQERACHISRSERQVTEAGQRGRSQVLTPESRPSAMSIRKKRHDQNCEPGSVATASGYTWNTNPGPGGDEGGVRGAEVRRETEVRGREGRRDSLI